MGAYQSICLSNFVRCLLEPALGGVYSPVAVVDIFLQVAHIVVLETVLLFVLIRQALVLSLQRLRVLLRAGTQILLGICEKVVRTCADEERSADFGVGHGQRGRSRGGRAAHQLLEQLSLFRGHGLVSIGVVELLSG